MKVFVSADLEGVTGVTHWDECDRTKADWGWARAQMEAEVRAVCVGAHSVGATHIRVRDAHASARNLRPDELPRGVELVREWSGHPDCMIEGIDGSYDALILVGYHSEAGSAANPLAHTLTGRFLQVRVNGRPVAELHLHAWRAAELGVPLAMVSGDEALGRLAEPFGAKAVATGRGQGRATIHRHPADVLLELESVAARALRDLPKPVPPVGPFTLEVDYRDVREAGERQWYPGASRTADRTVALTVDAWFDVLRALRFL